MLFENNRNNYEKIEPFDWNLDLDMNLDFAMWENELGALDEVNINKTLNGYLKGKKQKKSKEK